MTTDNNLTMEQKGLIITAIYGKNYDNTHSIHGNISHFIINIKHENWF